MQQRSLFTMIQVKRPQYPQGDQLFSNICVLTKGDVDTTQLVVVCPDASKTIVFTQRCLLMQVLPVETLQMLQNPIISPMLAEATIRQEPEAISLDEILLEQHLQKIVRRDAAL